MSLCEDNCDYEGYDSINKKALCKCKIKINLSSLSEIKINKNKILNNFIDLDNSLNIKIMKCYLLLFSKEGLIKNIGSYTILSIILLNLLSVIFFILKGYIIFKNKINEIINNNLKKNKKDIKNQKTEKKKKNKKQLRIIEIKYNNDNPPLKNSKIYKKDKRIKDNNNITIKSNTNLELLNNNKIKNKYQDKIIKKYNDSELNSLNYKRALEIDKRTYFQYYFSLLKVKHLIIFTFYTYTDYNSKIIKIWLFFFSFALYYAINALFFNDSTIHKIYEDNGVFNLLYQIPQILYSTLISNIIYSILKFLALSERNIIKIKENKEEKNEKISYLFKCLIIKFVFFFILNFLFLILFWYYLGCFCSVYRNTQTYLIKDTLISFGLTLFYPLIINLLPGIFRIISLNDLKNEFLYKFSKIIQLI